MAEKEPSQAPDQNSLPPALERLVAAITAQADDAAEAVVRDLRAEDAPRLVEMATGSDPDMRWWAIRSLAHIGTEAVEKYPSLHATASRLALDALNDQDPALRAVALMALAHLCQAAPTDSSQMVQCLAQHLHDDDGFVRQAAADALAQCGDAAIPALVSILEDTHEGARARAAYALRKIASYKAAAVLFPLLNDPHPLVRTYAQEGLDEMGLLENMLLIP